MHTHTHTHTHVAITIKANINFSIPNWIRDHHLINNRFKSLLLFIRGHVKFNDDSYYYLQWNFDWKELM